MAHHHGTSPLTRGKPNWAVVPLVQMRNIPAHAGKTGACGRPAVVSEEHPRSRGENSIRAEPLNCPPGTSPLTRGKRAR